MSSSTNSTNSINPPGYVDATDLSPGHYGKPLILDRVFLLLVQMINVLQKTAASQAQRLNFLSNWQKAYTDEMNQIHAFVAGNGDLAHTQTNNFTTGLPVQEIQNGKPVFINGKPLIANQIITVSIASTTHDPITDQVLPYPHSTLVGTVSPNNSGLDGTSSDASTARQELNTVNTTYTQEMQGNNNVISNDAKALQTNVNQTNDAVQAQTDMATSILQQMSTILTSIYQSA